MCFISWHKALTFKYVMDFVVVDRSIISLVVREVITIINIVLKKLIAWWSRWMPS